jgi:glycosyltransferase involved in cell wall biosynthesis
MEAGDLQEKLLFALTNRHLSDNAAVGRDFVVKNFSPEVVAEQAEQIYEEAIFRGNRLPRA